MELNSNHEVLKEFIKRLNNQDGLKLVDFVGTPSQLKDNNIVFNLAVLKEGINERLTYASTLVAYTYDAGNYKVLASHGLCVEDLDNAIYNFLNYLDLMKDTLPANSPIYITCLALSSNYGASTPNYDTEHKVITVFKKLSKKITYSSYYTVNDVTSSDNHLFKAGDIIKDISKGDLKFAEAISTAFTLKVINVNDATVTRRPSSIYFSNIKYDSSSEGYIIEDASKISNDNANLDKFKIKLAALKTLSSSDSIGVVVSVSSTMLTKGGFKWD